MDEYVPLGSFIPHRSSIFSVSELTLTRILKGSTMSYFVIRFFTPFSFCRFQTYISCMLWYGWSFSPSLLVSTKCLADLNTCLSAPTRHKYWLILTYLRRSTLFLPTLSTQNCHWLPPLSFSKTYWLIVGYCWRSTLFVPPSSTRFRHRLPTLSNSKSSRPIVT